MPSAWERLKARLLNKPGSVDLSGLTAVVDLAAGSADALRQTSDADLRRSVAGVPRDFIHADEPLATFLAIVREWADRQLGLRPFDVQLHAAAAMLRGTSVELATGEGKRWWARSSPSGWSVPVVGFTCCRRTTISPPGTPSG